LALVHMNGRVYDPIIGRFTSADPNIPDPTNHQSFNRYSYVLNNPLNYTDPSGFLEDAAVPQSLGSRIGGFDLAWANGEIYGTKADAKNPSSEKAKEQEKKDSQDLVRNGDCSGNADCNKQKSKDIAANAAKKTDVVDDVGKWARGELQHLKNSLEWSLSHPIETLQNALAPFAGPEAAGIGFIGKIGTATEAEIAAARAASGLTANAANRLANLPFQSGEIILREFNTSKGLLDVAAEALIVGNTLHLKDIAVFPRGSGKVDLGMREMLALRTQLAQEARAFGFDQLRITGDRVSGANPGKLVDVLIDLKRLGQ
jgi:hypothetical protein